MRQDEIILKHMENDYPAVFWPERLERTPYNLRPIEAIMVLHKLWAEGSITRVKKDKRALDTLYYRANRKSKRVVRQMSF